MSGAGAGCGMFWAKPTCLTGYIALVQETRIGLVDDAGAGHILLLSHASLAEPFQLAELQRRQARRRTGSAAVTLLPPWLALPLIGTALVLAWRREMG